MSNSNTARVLTTSAQAAQWVANQAVKRSSSAPAPARQTAKFALSPTRPARRDFEPTQVDSKLVIFQTAPRRRKESQLLVGRPEQSAAAREAAELKEKDRRVQHARVQKARADEIAKAGRQGRTLGVALLKAAVTV